MFIIYQSKCQSRGKIDSDWFGVFSIIGCEQVRTALRAASGPIRATPGNGYGAAATMDWMNGSMSGGSM